MACVWCQESSILLTECCLSPICTSCAAMATTCTPECGSLQVKTQSIMLDHDQVDLMDIVNNLDSILVAALIRCQTQVTTHSTTLYTEMTTGLYATARHTLSAKDTIDITDSTEFLRSWYDRLLNKISTLLTQPALTIAAQLPSVLAMADQGTNRLTKWQTEVRRYFTLNYSSEQLNTAPIYTLSSIDPANTPYILEERVYFRHHDDNTHYSWFDDYAIRVNTQDIQLISLCEKGVFMVSNTLNIAHLELNPTYIHSVYHDAGTYYIATRSDGMCRQSIMALDAVTADVLWSRTTKTNDYIELIPVRQGDLKQLFLFRKYFPDDSEGFSLEEINALTGERIKGDIHQMTPPRNYGFRFLPEINRFYVLVDDRTLYFYDLQLCHVGVQMFDTMVQMGLNGLIYKQT